MGTSKCGISTIYECPEINSRYGTVTYDYIRLNYNVEPE